MGKYRHRDRSSSRDYKRSRHDRSKSRDIGHCPKSDASQGVLLAQILEALKDQNRRLVAIESRGVKSPTRATLQADHEAVEVRATTLEPSNEQNKENVETTQSNETPIEVNSINESGEKNKDRNVTFEDVPDSEAPKLAANPIVEQLFRLKEKPTEECYWSPAIFDFARSAVQSGLQEDLRLQLLSKYQVKGEISFLDPPKINKELISVLKLQASVLKRDEYQVQKQSQVGACLNALGAAASVLLKPEVQEMCSEENTLALQHLAGGIQLLADLQYRLSLARRAFINPTLNILGKNVADNASVDEWLCGKDLAEEVKNAQACEKTARELLNAKPAPLKASNQTPRQQPTRPQGQAQHPQQRQIQGNAKAPARQSRPARTAGAQRSKSRGRRSSSLSHSYRH